MKPLGIPTETAAFFVSVAKSYAEKSVDQHCFSKICTQRGKITIRTRSCLDNLGGNGDGVRVAIVDGFYALEHSWAQSNHIKYILTVAFQSLNSHTSSCNSMLYHIIVAMFELFTGLVKRTYECNSNIYQRLKLCYSTGVQKIAITD